jgi:hypothetical protein
LASCNSRAARRAIWKIAATVLAVCTAIVGFAAFTAAPAEAATQSCSAYTYCLGFRSAMNNSALDGIYWSNETQQQAVTDQTPVHGLWGLQFETWTDTGPMSIQNGMWVNSPGKPNSTYPEYGIFELRSLVQDGGCLTEITSPRDQLRVTPCANQPGSVTDNQQQWYLVAGNNGNYTLRSGYDGNCIDVLNNSNGDGHWIGTWPCNNGIGSSNQQWAVADYTGTTASNQSNGTALSGSTAASDLASAHSTNFAHDIAQRNLPGSITFCNWAGYLAEGVVFYRTGSTTGGWESPVLSATNRCATFNIPRGQGIQASVEMHEFTGMFSGEYGWKYPPGGGTNNGTDYWTSGTHNDIVAASYTIGGVYTNLTLNFYGSTCAPTTGVNFNDAASRLGTVVVDNHQQETCRDSQNFGIETYVDEAAEAVEDFLDGATDFMRALGGGR